jgi:hypothetical protein
MILILLAILSGPSAFAESDGSSVGGGGTGGGGTTCNGQFLDNMLRKGRFDVSKDEAFAKVARPTLDRVRACLPFFADDLEMILSKPWFRVDCKMKKSTADQVYYAVEQLAYQDRNGVFLDDNLLKRLDGGDGALQNRGEMILHELVQGLRIEKALRNNGDFEVEETAVGILSGMLVENSFTSCEEMQHFVRKYLRTSYPTRAQLGSWKSQLDVSDVSGWLITQCKNGSIKPSTLNGNSIQYYFVRLVPWMNGTGAWGDNRILKVPNDEGKMIEDAQLRLWARLFLEDDHQGFYVLPPELRSGARLCEQVLDPTFSSSNVLGTSLTMPKSDRKIEGNSGLPTDAPIPAK